jgi:fatty acid desaturase
MISAAPFTANAVLYLVSLPQHCGLKDNQTDFRKCARSIRLGPVLEFLYWQMNWHAEHHMYAAVPCYNLKKVSRLIADDMPEPRSLGGAWREMRETWKRQQTEPGYQYDMPLPPGAVHAASGSPGAASSAGAGSEELVKSIGELAPGGLT